MRYTFAGLTAAAFVTLLTSALLANSQERENALLGPLYCLPHEKETAVVDLSVWPASETMVTVQAYLGTISETYDEVMFLAETREPWKRYNHAAEDAEDFLIVNEQTGDSALFVSGSIFIFACKEG